MKRELESLLEYKRRDVRELELGEGKSQEGMGLRGIEEEIKGVRELVEGLEAHWRSREAALEDLKREVEGERRGR